MENNRFGNLENTSVKLYFYTLFSAYIVSIWLLQIDRFLNQDISLMQLFNNLILWETTFSTKKINEYKHNKAKSNVILHTGTPVGSIWPNFVVRQLSSIRRPAYIFPTVSLPVFSWSFGGTNKSTIFFACNGQMLFIVSLSSESAWSISSAKTGQANIINVPLSFSIKIISKRIFVLTLNDILFRDDEWFTFNFIQNWIYLGTLHSFTKFSIHKQFQKKNGWCHHVHTYISPILRESSKNLE